MEPSSLDVAQLALFVGQSADRKLLAQLHRAGFAGLRVAHGYVIQHVVQDERSISELAARMGVTQQAASKSVRELVELGYLELAAGADARQRIVRLSARGKDMLQTARRNRRALERKLLRGVPAAHVTNTRDVLCRLLERLGGAEAVRARRVSEP